MELFLEKPYDLGPKCTSDKGAWQGSSPHETTFEISHSVLCSLKISCSVYSLDAKGIQIRPQ